MAAPYPTMKVGDRYHLLTVIKLIPNGDHGKALCRCDCGSVREVFRTGLRSGGTKSCGCLRRATVGSWSVSHGESYSAEYRAWTNAKQRCGNPANPQAHLYGGRGVVMCERWRDDFAAFLKDMGPRPKGMTLDRIDVNGNYEPGNCRWASPKEQMSNRRCNRYVLVAGEVVTFAEAARRLGVCFTTLCKRVKRGKMEEVDRDGKGHFAGSIHHG